MELDTDGFLDIEREASDLYKKHVRNKVTQDLQVSDELVYWIAKMAFRAGYNHGYDDGMSDEHERNYDVDN